MSEIRRLRYPLPPDGRPYEVKFPFRFDTKVASHPTPIYK